MATSPIYNWPEPDNTDLVKNGALAMRTLGDAIDTTMATMVPKTIVDAKGDLIAGTAADTAARLAVGNNGETLVADSSTSTGLRYTSNFAAGKNKIINGDFGVWQRGTTFTSLAAGSYCADRFTEAHDGTGTVTVTQQTFTPGTAPVSGYEGTYFLRDTLNTVGTSTYIGVSQAIEDVRTFAGQTVTLSFWAKADSARTSIVYFAQQFGTGGSSAVFSSTPSITYSTSWQRFTFTIAIPSVSGKTIGAGSSLLLGIRSTATVGSVLDIWGVQVEAGSVATAFQTATGTIQGELAACQRYYWRGTGAIFSTYGQGTPQDTRYTNILVSNPVPMRTIATSLEYSNLALYDGVSFVTSPSAIVLLGNNSTTNLSYVQFDKTGSVTQFRNYVLLNNNNSAGYLGLSAEL